MEALRYIQTVESKKIVIDNLDKFLGKKVEIIIIPFQEIVKPKNVKKPVRSAYGRLKEYANPELRKKEHLAWEMAVKEKYNDM